MEQTNTARNWTIIGALVVLVGLVAWFYSGGTGTMPSTGGTVDATQSAPAADAPAADAPAADAMAPADGTAAPADGTAAPADGTAAPADGTAAPATGGTANP
jgi:hypothetical protein